MFEADAFLSALRLGIGDHTSMTLVDRAYSLDFRLFSVKLVVLDNPILQGSLVLRSNMIVQPSCYSSLVLTSMSPMYILMSASSCLADESIVSKVNYLRGLC